MHILSTERLELRQLTTDDAGFILELTNDPGWLRYIGDRGIRTLDDARRYIETGPMEMYARLGFGLWAVEPRAGGAPIGICGVLRRDWLDGADIGFAFLPAFRGMGYAREAAAATLDHARALGFDRVLAIVSPGNEASIRLLVKLGMGFERMALPAADAREVCVYGLAFPPDGDARMSPNKQTVQAYMDAFARSDHADVLACLTDDVQWVIPGAFHLHGKEAFDGEIQNDAFVGSPTIQVTRMTEEGDVVVAEGGVRCARRDGGRLNAVFCDVFVLRDARISHLTSYLMELPEPDAGVSG